MTKPRGFQVMDPAQQRAIARRGGQAAHAQGVAHEWTREEAQAAGRKGGLARGRPLDVTPAHLARAQRWPIGQPVTVTKDNDATVDTTTRSAPWQLGGTWVVMVEGISGGYALARVRERSEMPA